MITTILIFITQTLCMLLWKGSEIKKNWVIGVIFIMIGVLLL
jgi:hypothetical protein